MAEGNVAVFGLINLSWYPVSPLFFMGTLLSFSRETTRPHGTLTNLISYSQPKCFLMPPAGRLPFFLWYGIRSCAPDNLAANYGRELADYIIYVIDVAGGDKVPRKGGPGITQSDLLIINKTDLAEAVGADLEARVQDSPNPPVAALLSQ